MSIETTSAPVEATNAPEIDLDAGEGLESSEGADEVVDPENDPNESFDDWLKRQDAKKAPKESDKAKPEPKEPKKDEEAPEPVKKEEKTSTKIKIKDKEYSTEELEASLTELKSVKEQHNLTMQQAEQLVELLKTNPGKILDKLDVPADVIERWYYNKYLLPPEERQAAADREELEARRGRDADAQLKAENAQKEQLKKQYQQEWNKRIGEALDAAGLPKSELTMARVAQKIKAAHASGRTDIKPTDVIDAVKQDLIDLQKSTIGTLSPEKLAETLGEETMARLREHEAEKYKQTKFESKPTKAKPREVQKKSERRFKNTYDVLNNLKL